VDNKLLKAAQTTSQKLKGELETLIEDLRTAETEQETKICEDIDKLVNDVLVELKRYQTSPLPEKPDTLTNVTYYLIQEFKKSQIPISHTIIFTNDSLAKTDPNEVREQILWLRQAVSRAIENYVVARQSNAKNQLKKILMAHSRKIVGKVQEIAKTFTKINIAIPEVSDFKFELKADAEGLVITAKTKKEAPKLLKKKGTIGQSVLGLFGIGGGSGGGGGGNANQNNIDVIDQNPSQIRQALYAYAEHKKDEWSGVFQKEIERIVMDIMKQLEDDVKRVMDIVERTVQDVGVVRGIFAGDAQTKALSDLTKGVNKLLNSDQWKFLKA